MQPKEKRSADDSMSSIAHVTRMWNLSCNFQAPVPTARRLCKFPFASGLESGVVVCSRTVGSSQPTV